MDKTDKSRRGIRLIALVSLIFVVIYGGGFLFTNLEDRVYWTGIALILILVPFIKIRGVFRRPGEDKTEKPSQEIREIFNRAGAEYYTDLSQKDQQRVDHLVTKTHRTIVRQATRRGYWFVARYYVPPIVGVSYFIYLLGGPVEVSLFLPVAFGVIGFLTWLGAR